MNLEQLGPILGPILLIMATMASCILVALRILEKRTQKKNGKIDLQMIPGHSEECERRGTELTTLTTQHKFVVGQIKEINTNVGNLWKYVKKNGSG